MSESTEFTFPVLPVLSVPLKSTDQLDFSGALNDYIGNYYVDDTTKHAAAIATLNQLRSDIRGVGMDSVGRDLLYKYYGQLELLELHFPIGSAGEDSVNLRFSWADSFSGQMVAQSSPAFEKASVLYNLAALLSNVASAASRTDQDGIKTACNYFECSAGVFQFISDNFLHAPSTDISKEFLTVLVNLMLAQAQECFVDKVLKEKKKSGMVMKLAMQCHSYYQAALDGLQINDQLKTYCNAAWTNNIKIKSKYYLAMSQFQRALTADADGQHGERVSRLKYADQLIQECIKIAKDISSNTAVLSQLASLVINSDSSTKKDGGVVAVAKQLSESLKAVQQVYAQKLSQACKDNDIIYHLAVPEIALLSALDKTSLVAAKKLTDVFPHLPQSIGDDLFKSLIPIDVYEKSSVYSEEKAKIVRSVSAKIEEADAHLEAVLASMKARETVHSLKEFQKIPHPSQSTVPDLVFECAQYVKSEEAKRPTAALLTQLQNLKNTVAGMLSEVDRIVEQDRNEYMSINAPGFTQRGPETAAENLRRDLDAQKNNLAMGNKGDEVLFQRYREIEGDINLLNGPTGNLEAQLSGGDNSERKRSIIDLPIPEQNNDMKLVQQIDNLLQKLGKFKKDRSTLLADLKRKVQEEDINELLVLNKSNEEGVFRVELQKFKSAQQKIVANISEQDDLISELSEEFDSLSKSDLYKKFTSSSTSANNNAHRFIKVKTVYAEIRLNLDQGLGFYDNVARMTATLLENAKRFLSIRQQERQEFSRNAVGASAADILQRRLNSMK